MPTKCDRCEELLKACRWVQSSLITKQAIGAYTPGAEERILAKLKMVLEPKPRVLQSKKKSNDLDYNPTAEQDIP